VAKRKQAFANEDTYLKLDLTPVEESGEIQQWRL